MTGKFYGVGVGPGSPDMLTLRAKRVLESVAAVYVPRATSGGDSLARSILEGVLDPRTRFIELDFPMVRKKDALVEHWDRAAGELATRLQGGEDVAFATLGDPLLYSTYNYLLATLQARFPEIPVETVPGITSISAATALANLPLAERDETLAIIPVPGDPKKLEKVLGQFDSVVLMKIGARLGMVLEVLGRMGLKEKAVLVSRAGLPGETLVSDLSTVEDRGLGYLSIIIVTQRGWKGR
jgi:precorrin-2/cobalt-factor-2 C20-methyltransferase